MTEKQFQPPSPGDVINFQGRKYTIGVPIGTGYFGTAYSCTDDWGNFLVAKVLVPQHQSYEDVQQNWLREFGNLVTLRHPNVTYIHDAFECDDTFYLIIERCNQTLKDLIEWPDFQGDVWFPGIARCVLQAINFIHRQNYVHKDLHPGNVFSSLTFDEMVPGKDPAWRFKVGDLGISRLLPDVDIFNTVLAKWMVPPEFLNPAEFGVLSWNVDIYHAGLLFLSILLGRIPTYTQDEVLNGLPRQTAEALRSPYAPAIARALRRHVAARTPTGLDFWRDLMACHGIPPLNKM